jgi:hypothetical protein
VSLVSDESEEMRRLYATVRVGDPPIFPFRFMANGQLNLDDDIQYCQHEWNDDPADPPIEGDVWSCTRAPGHKGPHVAEGFRSVYAVLWE